ncbi:MAG TPA: nuclear transport factor 2 family protein [Rhabdaerophilum sp.]|nr:nuclear transport factor 2 family protein [Rhabdaerophilum sp.]
MQPSAFSKEAFAGEWIASFNTHDLERILEHYDEAIVLTSPLVPRVMGEGVARIEGKDMLRAYFSRGLTLRPDLHFTMRKVYGGTGALVIAYHTQDGREAAEQMDLDPQGRIVAVRAHYADAN